MFPTKIFGLRWLFDPKHFPSPNFRWGSTHKPPVKPQRSLGLFFLNICLWLLLLCLPVCAVFVFLYVVLLGFGCCLCFLLLFVCLFVCCSWLVWIFVWMNWCRDMACDILPVRYSTCILYGVVVCFSFFVQHYLCILICVCCFSFWIGGGIFCGFWASLNLSPSGFMPV